jgi:TIR domain
MPPNASFFKPFHPISPVNGAVPTERKQETTLFISYVEADRSWAEWIAWQAEQEGYTVIFRVWDFQPGNNEVRLVDEAIRQAHHVLLVLSPEYWRPSPNGRPHLREARSCRS